MVRNLLGKLLRSPYVEASKIAGFPAPIFLGKYVLPEIIPTVGIMATLSWGKVVLEVSSLGFLGIGIDPPEPELGAMISEGIPYMRTSHGVVFWPGIVIFLFVFASLLLGNRGNSIAGGNNT
jgi:ABC-type dipeptide/oligopeptide/nickel transport system permease subunit